MFNITVNHPDEKYFRKKEGNEFLIYILNNYYLFLWFFSFKNDLPTDQVLKKLLSLIYESKPEDLTRYHGILDQMRYPPAKGDEDFILATIASYVLPNGLTRNCSINIFFYHLTWFLVGREMHRFNAPKIFKVKRGKVVFRYEEPEIEKYAAQLASYGGRDSKKAQFSSHLLHYFAYNHNSRHIEYPVNEFYLRPPN